MRDYGKWLLLLAAVGCIALGCGNGGAAPKETLSMKGGAGNAGNGGPGGGIMIDVSGSKGVQFVSSGSVETGFTLPGEPTPDLGDVPLIVDTVDVTVDVWLTQGAAQAAVTTDGTPYMFINSNGIYIRHPSATDELVTGLRVGGGRTLTLGLNKNYAGALGEDSCYIAFSDDVDVRGTLAVQSLDTGTLGGAVEQRHGAPAEAKDKGYLYVSASYCLFLTGSGFVDASGDDAAGTDERGGDGGRIQLAAGYGLFLHGTIDGSGGNGTGTGVGGHACMYAGSPNPNGVWLSCGMGTTVNSGPVDASGGAGSAGGMAGNIDLLAMDSVYNTAALRSNGGTGSSDIGLMGGTIALAPFQGSCYNSGTLEANGGGSVDATGGGGGSVQLRTSGTVGVLYNSGRIEANGGDSDNSSSGMGGNVVMENWGGDLRSSGSISANGGDAPGTGATAEMGGNITVHNGVGAGSVAPIEIVGDILLTGAISLDGGDGDDGGGMGGWLMINNEAVGDMGATDYGVMLIGYASADLSGGDGNPGLMGGMFMVHTFDMADGGNPLAPAGAITVRLDVDLSGGEGGAGGGGGPGGIYEASTTGGPLGGYSTGQAIWTHEGDLDLHGGDGPVFALSGGMVNVTASDGAVFNGTLNLDGGNANGSGDVDGGGGGFVNIMSAGDIDLSGTLSGMGGDSTGAGIAGLGTGIDPILGAHITSRMSYYLSGGDGDVASGFGGDGGFLSLMSLLVPTDHVGAWDVSGGAGSGTSVGGTVLIDGVYYERP